MNYIKVFLTSILLLLRFVIIGNNVVAVDNNEQLDADYLKAKQFQNNNIDSALFYANLSLIKTDSNFELSTASKTNILIGELLITKGESQKAINYLNKAYSIAIMLKDYEALCDYYINKSQLFANSGLYQEAVSLLDQAVEYELEINSPSIKAKIYNKYGSIYYMMDKLPEAQEYFYKAIYIYQSQNSNNELAAAYNSLGVVYSSLMQPNESLKNYKKGLEYAIVANNQTLIGKFYNNIGLSYQKLGEYDKALDYFLQSIAIKTKSGNYVSLASSLTNLGQFYFEVGRYSDALETYEEGINIYLKDNRLSNISELYYQIGDLHYTIANDELAIQYLQKSLTIAEEINLWATIEKAAKLLSQINNKHNKFESAFKFIVLSSQARDSVSMAEQKNQLVRIQMQHEIRKIQQLQDAENLQRDLLEAKKDNQIKQIRAISIAGFVILMVIIFFMNRYSSQKQRTNRQLLDQNNKISRQNEEIEIQKDILEKQNTELQQTHENIKHLSNVGQQITSHLSFDEIVSEVYKSTSFISNDTLFLIGIKDPETQDFYAKYVLPGESDFKEKISSLNNIDSIYEHTFVFGEEIFTGNLSNDNNRDYYNKEYIEIKENAESVICVPLTLKNKKVGVILLVSKHENAFLPVHLDIIKTLASYIAIALENAETYIKIDAQRTELEKLNATKDLVFSIISHDLRSPIGNMEIMLDIIDENLSDYNYDNAQGLLAITKSAARTAYNLLDNLLYWAKTQKNEIVFEPKLFDLSKKINEVISLFETNTTTKNISLNTDILDKMMIYADEDLIYTVLRNLVSNAIKFTPKNGSVTIVGKKIDAAVKISVVDTGVGISHENMKRIFDSNSHFTTYGTNHEKGTGLGLALCKTFIRKHSGKLTVESVPDKGSTFSFTIPVK